MGADEDIDPAGGQLPQDLRLLLGISCPGQQLHIHGHLLEPAQGGLVMLPGKHGGGHQDGALLAGQDAFERRPHGDLRLAEAHVAAQEPIHGMGLLHIRLDVRNALQLIVGFHIGEPFLKFRLDLVIRQEGKALRLFPFGIQGDQLIRHILGGTLHIVPGLLPLYGGQLVELYMIIVPGANVPGHHIQLGDGHIQHVLARILDGNIVLGDPLQLQLPDPHKAPDAVERMHHQIPGGNIRQGTDLLALFVLFRLFPGMHGLCLGNEGGFILRIGKAPGKAADHQQHPSRLTYAVRGGDIAGNAAVPQVIAQNADGLFRACHQHSPVALLAVQGKILRQLPDLAAPGSGLHGFDVQQLPVGDPVAPLQKGIQIHADPLRQQLLHPGHLHQVPLQSLAQGTGFQQHPVILHILGLRTAHPLLHRHMLAEPDRAGNVIQQGHGSGIQQGQVLVDVRQHFAPPEPLCVPVQPYPQLRRTLAPEGFCQSFDLLRQQLRLGHQGLLGRRNGDLFLLIHPALGCHLKGSDAVQGIPPELQPQGHGSLHREYIQQSAPDGKLGRALHLFTPDIAAAGQLLCQGADVVVLPDLEGDGTLLQQLRRQGGLQQRLAGCDQQGALSRLHRRKRRQPHMLVASGQPLHRGQRHFLGGEGQSPVLPQHQIDVVAQPPGGGVILRYNKTGRITRQGGKQLRLVDVGYAGKRYGGNAPVQVLLQFLHRRQFQYSILEKLHGVSFDQALYRFMASSILPFTIRAMLSQACSAAMCSCSSSSLVNRDSTQSARL
ncbi:unknown [Ruminococcus sp. CAG:379]|nr:unknown [Ruminococcus sp. CAG:379]